MFCTDKFFFGKTLMHLEFRNKNLQHLATLLLVPESRLNSQLASECWLLRPLTEHSEASWEISRLSGPSKSVAKCCKFLFLNYKCIKVFPKKILSVQNIYKYSHQKKPRGGHKTAKYGPPGHIAQNWPKLTKTVKNRRTYNGATGR